MRLADLRRLRDGAHAVADRVSTGERLQALTLADVHGPGLVGRASVAAGGERRPLPPVGPHPSVDRTIRQA